MSTRHVSFRIDAATIDALDELARSRDAGRTEMAATLLEEGIRMERHPGIVFAPGPAGRRPTLTDGPDVWEIVQAARNTGLGGEAAVDATARWMGLRRDQVERAVAYYADYREEIDDWIERVARDAERERAAWERRGRVLG